MQTVSTYEAVKVDKAMLVEALKGGAMGAGVVFAADFLLSKFLHNGKIRAALCAAAPIALAMWLKEKNPELAQGLAIGGAGAGIYKLLQAFLYEKLHIPYAGMEDVDVYPEGYEGDFYDQYGILEEVPVEETQEYGALTEIPAEEGEVIMEEQPQYSGAAYGTSLA